MAKVIRKIMPTKLHIPKLLRVAAYARVSSGKDAMLHSLSAQVSYYSELIQKNPEWSYAGVYADEAITGTKDTREKFMELMADCRAGKIDMIITKSISRLARNTVTLLETVRELKALGIDIYFEEQNIHSISGDGELMLTILASYAQEESLSASENRKWQIREHYYKNGLHATWQFMYGFRIKNGVVRIHEEEAAVIRWIYESYLDGMTVSEIAATLRERNVPSQRGGIWSPKRIDELLKNEKNAGNSIQQKKYVQDHISKKLVINHGELPKYAVTACHPSIVDPETYNMAMFKMALNAARYTQPVRAPFGVFASMIRCPKCGKNYRRKVTRSETAWNCATYLTFGKAYCHTKQIPENVLMNAAATVLKIPEFDDAIFKERIDHIIVPSFNQLVFVFKDGSRAEYDWQDRSRSESWTAEMKQQASERARRRIAV